MKCPYCKGDVPDDARKCMHCGEWVRERAGSESSVGPGVARTPGEMFGRVWHGGLTQGDLVEGVRWYVKYRIVMAVVGGIIGLILLVTVILPGIAGSGRNDPFLPGGVTCYNSSATIGPNGIPTCVER